MPILISFLKKIATIYLIISLTLFSPFAFSALPLAGTFVGVIAGIAGSTPQGKKLFNKIGKEIFGDEPDDVKVKSDGSVVLLNYGECTFGKFTGSYATVIKKYENMVLTEWDWDSVVFNISFQSEHETSTNLRYIFHVDYGEDHDYYSHAGKIFCDKVKKKELSPEDIADEVEKRRKAGDKDAQNIYNEAKKRFGDDDDPNKPKKSDDDDDPNKPKKPKDDDDDDSNKPKKPKDDDDDQCSTEEHQDDEECNKNNNDDDENVNDAECSTSPFHEKVCTWIDWTYKETDNAKKEIASYILSVQLFLKEYFDSGEIDEIDRKKLNEVVHETEVPLKKYDFDVVDACPVPKSVTTSLLGHKVEIEVFNFRGVCQYAGFIEFGLKTTATIIGINIIAGRKMGE